MSATEAIFAAPTNDVTVREFADHMPKGRVWQAKTIPDSNLYALISGAARPFNLSQQEIEKLSLEFDINQSDELLSEWETSVGLPDDCIALSSDLDKRRANVIERFRKQPLVTLAEMQAAVDAVFVDAGIILVPGFDFYSLEYDLEATLWGDISDKFVIVAIVPDQFPTLEYELEVELTPGIDLDLLRCFMEQFIPSNVLLQIEQVAADA